MSLKARLAIRFVFTFVIMGAMVFLPAGSAKFWQGWVFFGILFIPMLWSSFYFYKRDPQLVARRLQSKEKNGEQKVIMRVRYRLLSFVW